MNYYNEFDPFAAAWLRKLIEKKLIPNGDVDDRSIVDVKSNDLRGYTQCHFFAGIGGWSYALQLAGWPTDRPVWTGSCPCQPFSTAGKQKGKADERHLWPMWFNLLRESRPPVVFGEQVSSAIHHGWWDDVADDLEGEGYTTRAEIRSANSVGAPHRRERLFFMAHYDSERCQGEPISIRSEQKENIKAVRGCKGSMAHTESERSSGASRTGGKTAWRQETGNSLQFRGASEERCYWRGEWIDCPDGKQRLIEPSIRLLANGFSVILGGLQSIEQKAKEEIEKYGASTNGNSGQVLFAMWESLCKEKNWEEQSIRMCGEFYEKEILLHFLLCIESAFKRSKSSCIKETGKDFYEDFLPILWEQRKPSCSSHRWEPREQQTGEFADALSALSQFLARSAYSYWKETRKAHAASNRVAALKAFGNAIVPQVAAEFIKAYKQYNLRGDQPC